MYKNLKIIAFDADDTLWVNEPYYQETEKEFCLLLKEYLPAQAISEELFKTEMKNLHLYGYGAKGFMLSMIETANRISNHTLPPQTIDKIIELGHQLLQKPIVLLKGVEETLTALHGNYKLIVATKGDLLDQERKLKKSGLEHFFHHIEIMSEKEVSDYQKLLRHLDCKPENFLMAGNSVRSDILPVLELGAYAAHIPYHVTWAHEQQDENISHNHFIRLTSISEIIKFLKL